MPQASVDPVVLAAMIVVRLQTVIAREVAPTDPAVLTVGSIQSGTKSNVIGDHAVLQLNVRSYSDQTRNTDPGRRPADRAAPNARPRGRPQDPEFELFDRFPPTVNDPATTARVRAAFDAFFGDRAEDLPLQSASEDFSDIPDALSVPYSYWGIGGIDPDTYRRAAEAGRVVRGHPGQPLADLRPGHPAHPRHRHPSPGGSCPRLARLTRPPPSPGDQGNSGSGFWGP